LTCPTQGILPLRQKIAEKLKRENQIDAKAEEILITAGVSGGLFLAFAALLNPGEEIIVPDPYFVAYKQLLKFLGAKPRFVSTYPDFCLRPEKIEAIVNRKTKAILLNSPNNPTGQVLERATIEAMVRIAKKHNLWLISDEVYEAFIFDGRKNFSPANIYEKTITLNGFSKIYAMTGWRLGYLHGPKEIVAEMAKLQQYTFVCGPSFAQKAALKGLDMNFEKEIKRNYQRKRDLIYHGLRDHFRVVKPEGAFYLFPQAPDGRGMDFVERAVKKNVLLVPGSVFSERNSHFRISFAATEKTIYEGVKILTKMVGSYKL